MAIAEKLQWVVSANADSAINAFKKTGQAAEKELGGAEKRLDKVGAGMTKMGAGAMAAAGVVAVGLWKIGSGASDLAESINAVNVTFGEAADGVLELGENAAKSVGLSKREFGMLAVQFSAFADKIAGSGGNVVGTLDEMTTRAADFASVMNIDVAEAARIFQSALAGEQEPIKKFGIDLSAAAASVRVREQHHQSWGGTVCHGEGAGPLRAIARTNEQDVGRLREHVGWCGELAADSQGRPAKPVRHDRHRAAADYDDRGRRTV